MKPDDPVFNVKFVEAIERNECLWNYSVPEYSKRNVTEKAWRNISVEFNESVSISRERWRNIRTAYFKSQKTPTSGSGLKSRKPYYLSNQLQFLSKVKKDCVITGNLTKLTEEVGTSFSDTHTAEANINVTNVNEISEDNLNTIFDSVVDENSPIIEGNETMAEHPKRRVIKKTNKESLSETDLAFVDWMRHKREGNDDQDANLLFLKSLLPDMRKLTPHQNRKFRLKVLGFLDDLMNDSHEQTNFCTPSPTNTISWSSNPEGSNISYFCVDSPTTVSTPTLSESI